MFKYITQDNHLMKTREIMWRVCDSGSNLFSAPVSVIFHQETGYNMKEVSTTNFPNGGRIINFEFDTEKNPFHPNHIHFFDKNKATDYLKTIGANTAVNY